MILWTIQPIEVYELIQKSGVYHCIIEKSFLADYRDQYDWLVNSMKTKIGPPPCGVSYPAWAWYMWEGVRKKPDLRRERWRNGWKGDRFACMEIDIPEKDVVLSDFDSWSIILLNGLLSDSEEEDVSLEKEYNNLLEMDQKQYRDNNWERAFNLTYFDNGWAHRGDSIQATFWELRKEDIQNVRFFTSAIPKPEYLKDR